ncbi:MAG: hypothetical protein P1U75_10180 [Antarcticimicrobium sp.]|uniref:AbiU2 domain-containing protein n=1 Tax=Antarcticimicrobium sp. TaxID=2824147 RepID=UPI002610055F|nr:hypothetical protein [Antarcticimicrobium sp.]MDF1717017.1 hypothetical protein [Antarcticimicrobium sp.]
MTNAENENLAKYIEDFGPDFGTDLFNLQNSYFNIAVQWRFYKSLFGVNQQRIDLLNKVSGIFFREVERTLFESVITGLCRITDPIETGRGNGARKNLTFRVLEKHIENSDMSIFEEFMARFDEGATFARDWRNRKLSHLDYDVARGGATLETASRAKVQELIDCLGELLQWIHQEYLDMSLSLDVGLPPEDEMRVLELLYLSTQEEENFERQLKERIERRDFSDMPKRSEVPDWLLGLD